MLAVTELVYLLLIATVAKNDKSNMDKQPFVDNSKESNWITIKEWRESKAAMVYFSSFNGQKRHIWKSLCGEIDSRIPCLNSYCERIDLYEKLIINYPSFFSEKVSQEHKTNNGMSVISGQKFRSRSIWRKVTKGLLNNCVLILIFLQTLKERELKMQ